ncbi:uncharacterized protein HaLaN_05689, partial [Haematococcus lacustris]
WKLGRQLAHGRVHVVIQLAVTFATVLPEAIQGSTGLSRLYCDMSRHRSSRTVLVCLALVVAIVQGSGGCLARKDSYSTHVSCCGAETETLPPTEYIPGLITVDPSSAVEQVDLRERMLLDSSQQSWESAAACEGLPTVYNSVSDKLSRRWATVDQSTVCWPVPNTLACPGITDGALRRVFRVPFVMLMARHCIHGLLRLGEFAQVPCLSSPNIFIAKADALNQLWGWVPANGSAGSFSYSCRFAMADGRPMYDWMTAPVCPGTPTPLTAEYDNSGRLWGYNVAGGQSCAFKSAAGMSMPLAAATSDKNSAAIAPTWSQAPACDYKLTDTNGVPDSFGRRWGAHADGSTCAFKSATGTPLHTWNTAPRCLQVDPVTSSSPPDSESHIWASDGSCAFKDAALSPIYTWPSAPRCQNQPSVGTAVPDFSGKLWGWESGSACAYRASDGSQVSFDLLRLWAPESETPGSPHRTGPVTRHLLATSGWWWAPACKNTVSTSYAIDKVDSSLLWGSDSGSSCAFKDSNGKPLQLYDITPVCTSNTQVVRDSVGRSWGWQDGRSCRATSAAPSPSSSPMATSTSTIMTFTSTPSGTVTKTWTSRGTCSQANLDQAATCPDLPTMDSAQVDSTGYLWGCNGASSCRYRYNGKLVSVLIALLSFLGFANRDHTACDVDLLCGTADWKLGPNSSTAANWLRLVGQSPLCPDTHIFQLAARCTGSLVGLRRKDLCFQRWKGGFPVFQQDLAAGNVASYYNDGMTHVGGHALIRQLLACQSILAADARRVGNRISNGSNQPKQDRGMLGVYRSADKLGGSMCSYATA